MRIFVSEYLTSGACPAIPLDSSLMREGNLMVTALLEDLESLSDVYTLSTRDSRFEFQHSNSFRQVFRASSLEEERELFDALTNQADAVIVIAPETDRVLERRVRTVSKFSPRVNSHNCQVDAIALCADKLLLPHMLGDFTTTVIPTELIEPQNHQRFSFEFPIVMKPRDGAGCEETYLIDSNESWSRWCGSVQREMNWVVQPFVPGVALSSVAIFQENGSLHSVLPLGAQHVLLTDQRLSYQGGSIPWTSPSSDEAERQNHRFFSELAIRLPGLKGYVGADWIWDEAHRQLHLVEINPRLTTSYLGYRQLFGNQIAASMIDRNTQLISKFEDQYRFDAAGTIEREKRHTVTASCQPNERGDFSS